MSDLDYEMNLEYTIDYLEKDNGRLEAENKRLRDLLKRHYSFDKKCGHTFDCVCLQDETKSALEGEK